MGSQQALIDRFHKFKTLTSLLCKNNNNQHQHSIQISMLIHIAIGALIAQCANGANTLALMHAEGITITLDRRFSHDNQVNPSMGASVYYDGATLRLIARAIGRDGYKELAWKPEYLMLEEYVAGEVTEIGETSGKLNTFLQMVRVLAEKDQRMFVEWAYDNENLEDYVELEDITDPAIFTAVAEALASIQPDTFVDWVYRQIDEADYRFSYATVVKILVKLDEEQLDDPIDWEKISTEDAVIVSQVIKELAAQDPTDLEWMEGKTFNYSTDNRTWYGLKPVEEWETINQTVHVQNVDGGTFAMDCDFFIRCA